MNVILGKMRSIPNQPVEYFLKSSGEDLSINSLIGEQIKLEFKNNIFCTNCQKKIKKSFSNGYCYPCFTKLAECDMCIMRPELCHFSKGTCRDEEFAKTHCMIPHIVYVSDTSSLKVGITRKHNTSTRWVDQGASKAVAFWSVATRKESGDVESFLKEYIKDKTNWRNMLRGLVAEEDMEFKREELIDICESADLPGEAIYEEEIRTFEYPVLSYPTKVSSINLLKNPILEGKLTGVRGQYLYFGEKVINIRSHAGYEVELSV